MVCVGEGGVGIGAILHMAENHSFELMAGLGEGGNNRAELLSLKILLLFAAEKGCRSLKVFGDSLNVINWVKRIQACKDLLLQKILLTIWDIIDSFESFTCSHVYRENNSQADTASKEGLQLVAGVWKIKERLEDVVSEFYHCPFIEAEDL